MPSIADSYPGNNAETLNLRADELNREGELLDGLHREPVHADECYAYAEDMQRTAATR